MCYAGIGKGLTALASAMILAAERAGAGEALRAEMERSQKTLLNRLDGSIPDMFPKVYPLFCRMEEISSFLGTNRPESEILSRNGSVLRATRLQDVVRGERRLKPVEDFPDKS